ncbi:MAG: hypothetical protein WEB60_13790, partial [Terrimicrobiaceae bacterium]
MKSFRFSGNESRPYQKSEILEKMVTKQYKLFTSWVTGVGTYNEEAVRQDEFIILNFLQDKG